MTTPHGVRVKVRGTFYKIFYRLPARWRRRVVRLVQPTYTIGGVILVRDADAPPPGRLLLLRQPSMSGWSLPAGLMDRGEKPIQCAVRELREETGVRADPERMRPANPNALVHTDGQWVDMVFETEVPADTELIIDHGEVLDAAWHPIDNLPPMTVSTARLLAHYGIGPYAEYPEVKE